MYIASSIKWYYLYDVLTKLQNAAAAQKLYPQCVISQKSNEFHFLSHRTKSRKDKNKLASRACRLKKKAQHEANKIKLSGLEEEHSKDYEF